MAKLPALLVAIQIFAYTLAELIAYATANPGR
jgi:hypothetical protein